MSSSHLHHLEKLQIVHTHTVFPLLLAQCAHSAFSRVDFVISQSKLKFDLKSGDFNCQKSHHNNKFAIVALLSRSCPLFPCLEIFFPSKEKDAWWYNSKQNSYLFWITTHHCCINCFVSFSLFLNNQFLHSIFQVRPKPIWLILKRLG